MASAFGSVIANKRRSIMNLSPGATLELLMLWLGRGFNEGVERLGVEEHP